MFRFIIFLVSLNLISCGTILTNRIQTVEIKSVPSGAEYAVIDKRGNEIVSGYTPDVIKLRNGRTFSKEYYNVVIEKKGYQKKEYSLNPKFNAVTMLNIIPFLDPVGLLIDGLTGAFYRFPREARFISTELKKKSSTKKNQIVPKKKKKKKVIIEYEDENEDDEDEVDKYVEDDEDE